MGEWEKIEDALLHEERLIMPFHGINMLPMLRADKDCVVIEPKKNRFVSVGYRSVQEE